MARWEKGTVIVKLKKSIKKLLENRRPITSFHFDYNPFPQATVNHLKTVIGEITKTRLSNFQVA